MSSNIIILDLPGSTASPATVNGDEITLDGSKKYLDIQAANFGGDGTISIQASSNTTNSIWKTLEDANTISGLAEYTSNISGVVVVLPAGWKIRARFVLTSGTANNVQVAMGG